jgi:hypothetical protein
MQFEIRTVDGRVIVADDIELLPFDTNDTDTDLILLDVADAQAGDFLCIQTGFQQRLTPVSTVGFSADTGFSLTAGAGIITDPDGPGQTFLINVSIANGQSGSPIVNDAGMAIGVAKGTLDPTGETVVIFIALATFLATETHGEADCA